MPQQKFLFSLNGHTNWVRTCQLSPGARLAVSGGEDHSVRVWDLETRATLHAFDELDGSVNVAAFHPDGAPAGWLAGWLHIVQPFWLACALAECTHASANAHPAWVKKYPAWPLPGAAVPGTLPV